MSLAKKVAWAAAVLMAIGSFAAAEEIGLTVGLDVGFGDVLSQLALEVTPSIEWSGTRAFLDITVGASYTKSFAAGAGAGSMSAWEELSYAAGDDVSVTGTLYNENGYSFEGDGFSGSLEPSAEVSAGMFYGIVGLPVDYVPSPLSVALYATVGVAGDNWTGELTADFGISGGFNFEDIVLYGELTVSFATVSLTATIPGTFDAVTLSPAVDLSFGPFIVGLAADLDLGASGTALSPSLSVSLSF